MRAPPRHSGGLVVDGEQAGGRGRAGTGGLEPNPLGFVGLSAEVGALSLSRDQKERIEQGLARPHLQTCHRLHVECARRGFFGTL